ncbi:MAG: DUF190 domain-containing protein [Melioribacteraceae bacterium]|nr:DUF190 domain-containing protein [Melioribacteraceae bacterium]MCF8264356.1 DUF190 domain-containing protein [Melioribacteraceae bacterium]MCF8413413.1 DUF190 domain-containing protein [Melioribacteraceae bacterium]
MKKEMNAKLLRIFMGESHKIGAIPVYEKIVGEAKLNGLSGATVYKGIMGYGGGGKIHSAKVLALANDLPLIIEIVDLEEKIEKFLPILDRIFEDGRVEGLITMEHAEIIRYTIGKFD